MLIFVLWHKGTAAGRALDGRAVEAQLQTIFAPLFADPPASHLMENNAMGLVWLEKPVNGWRAEHYEVDPSGWALAPKYPVTARMVLQQHGIFPAEGRVLLDLCQQLETNPEPFLRDLAPMFASIWGDHQRADTFIQNDGLGHVQLFEHEDQRLWAISNKIMAFRALGIDLRPDPQQWAVRMTLDWFPMQLSGYRHISFVPLATQLHLTLDGIARRQFPILRHWLRKEKMTPEQCLESAYDGFHRHLRAVAPLVEHGVCGLTGGRDSRAVASALIKEDITAARYVVRGRGRNRIDAEIAKELANLAGIALRVKMQAGAAPKNAEELRRCLSLALLWQAGYIDIQQHDSFMNNLQDVGGGDVNFMGQHGEIGRGYFAQRIHAQGIKPTQFEEALLQFLLKENTPGHFLLRRSQQEYVYEIIRAAYRQADDYDLHGLDRLDFFYLYERTRRWASAGNHIQPGIIVTPFLIPEYIHAVYNYPAHLRNENCPFHTHIVQRNMPQWTSVIYEKERKEQLEQERLHHQRRKSLFKYFREQFFTRFPELKRSKPNGLYSEEGLPLINSALQQTGFWNEVFDPDLVRRRWFRAPSQFIVTAMLPSVLSGD